MPFAEDLDKEQIAIEIDNFIQIIYEICAIRGINFIGIKPIRIAMTRNDFIVNDSLHQSEVQYATWVQKIIPFFLNYKYD